MLKINLEVDRIFELLSRSQDHKIVIDDKYLLEVLPETPYN